MCGRARACSEDRAKAAAAGIASSSEVRWEDVDSYRPSPNASPGMSLAAVREDGRLETMRWGLHDDPFRQFNARSETASRLFPNKTRAVVVIDGFYEWTTGALKEKQPHYAFVDEDRPLFVAALCDDGKKRCTLLTRDVVPSLRWLHDRMPVLLPDEESANEWMKNGLVSKPPPRLETRPVTKKMSKLGYQENDASDPVKPPKKMTDFFTTTKKRPRSEETSKAKDETTHSDKKSLL